MKYFIGIVVAVCVVLGAWYFYSSSRSQSAPQPSTQAEANAAAHTNTGTTAAAPESAGSTGSPQAGATVTYTASGFSPATVTIKKGESVTFVDQGTGKMWVGSNMHPDHTGYSGTTRSAHCPDTAGAAFDQCAAGNAYTFTFQKVGTWKYHNHVVASAVGTIIVTE